MLIPINVPMDIAFATNRHTDTSIPLSPIEQGRIGEEEEDWRMGCEKEKEKEKMKEEVKKWSKRRRRGRK